MHQVTHEDILAHKYRIRLRLFSMKLLAFVGYFSTLSLFRMNLLASIGYFSMLRCKLDINMINKRLGGAILNFGCLKSCRGFDAPESQMPYGKEAKQVLLNLVEGKSPRVLVYDQDCYGRSVADIYSRGVFFSGEFQRF